MNLYETTRELVKRGCPEKLLTDSKGRTMLADEREWPGVHHWYAGGSHGRWYAIAVMMDGSKTPLHRIIINAQPGQFVDHINRNGLDNRRENLRLCTQAQNNCNRLKRGCWFCSTRRKWVAHIKVGGRRIALGRFDTMEAAQDAYKVAAIKYHGEFAGEVVRDVA